MSKSTKPEIVTPIEYEEVVVTQRLPGINYDRRMAFGRLIALTSASLELPADFASPEDLQSARPEALQPGLYILPNDSRYEDAELRIGNVVFPSQEFHWVARSPEDLARQAKADTRKSRRGNPDRDETEHAAQRSAGHALGTKLQTINDLQAKLLRRRRLIASLQYDLGGTWPHYRASNLETHREEIDQAIHETVEVAAVNLSLGNVAVEGLHRAVKVHLYRPDTSPEHRLTRWHSYLTMVERHSRAKMQIAENSRRFTDREFVKYKPFLDDVLF